jgi:hypothetical protein
VTHRQIINKALLFLGQGPITADALSTTAEADTSITVAYEGAWREVLEANAWSDLLVMVKVAADTDEDDELVTDDLGRYRFVVPETSIRVQSVHKTDGTNDLTAKIRAKYVYSKETEILLTYVSGDDLVPPDLTDLDADIEPVLPSIIQDAVSYRLASLIAFRVTQNVDLQQSIEGRYYQALSMAKAADMRPEGGETFWGNLSANAALEELDY